MVRYACWFQNIIYFFHLDIIFLPAWLIIFAAFRMGLLKY